MGYIIRAACGCHTGKIRKNNEDNFFFNGNYLERENNGLVRPLKIKKLRHGFTVAVFDGMGGENFGEFASYAAAQQMKSIEFDLSDVFVPKEEFLEELALRLDEVVVETQRKMCTERMGTTMVSFCFWGGYVYACNVGDSRAYQLRDGKLVQMSRDHVEKRLGKEGQKTPLTQYLGFGTDEIQIEPFIIKDKLKSGDKYLLCSDGLTDMLNDYEISDIMNQSEDIVSCVDALIESALKHGGRDNITVIVCEI